MDATPLPAALAEVQDAIAEAGRARTESKQARASWDRLKAATDAEERAGDLAVEFVRAHGPALTRLLAVAPDAPLRAAVESPVVDADSLRDWQARNYKREQAAKAAAAESPVVAGDGRPSTNAAVSAELDYLLAKPVTGGRVVFYEPDRERWAALLRMVATRPAAGWVVDDAMVGRFKRAYLVTPGPEVDGCVRAGLIAALTAAAPKDGRGEAWRPIREAPMDGTKILVLHEGMTQPIISWVTELDVGYYKGSVWMPLPDPPANHGERAS